MPTPGANIGIDRVEVEAHVQEGRAVQVLQRLAHRALETVAVDVAHREHLHPEPPDQFSLRRVERAHTDECDPLERRRRPGLAREHVAGGAERGGERHPVHVAGGRALGQVEIAVRVDPQHSARAVHVRHPAERADRDRVVATQHERHEPAATRVPDERCDALARAHDRLEVARPRIPDLRRLGKARVHVAPVDAVAAETRDPLLKACVPDRGGTHVDAAAARAEVEPSADHGHRPRCVRAVHRPTG